MAREPRLRLPEVDVTPGQWRRALVVAGILGVALILWLSRGALFPFFLGALLAFVIAPAVEVIARIQPWYRARPQLARSLGVAVVYGAVLAAVIVPAIVLAPRILEESEEFIDEAPNLFAQAQDRIETLVDRYEERVPEGVRERIDQAVNDLGTAVGDIVTGVLARTAGLAFSTLAAMLGYISVPFFVFYAVRDRERAFAWFYSLFPPSVRADVEQIVSIAAHVSGAYLRGQIFLALLIFATTYIGLSLMGVPFALALAFFAGLTELIPIIGPIIGFVPAFIVIVATEPDKWWWIVLFYLGVQAAENYILVPRIHSHSVSLHPVFVLLLLAIGGALFGLVGVLLAVPVAAAARDIFVYIYQRLGEAEERRLGAPPAAVDTPREVRAEIEESATEPATEAD